MQEGCTSLISLRPQTLSLRLKGVAFVCEALASRRQRRRKRETRQYTKGIAALSNSWIIFLIWLYIALNRTPNMDCYWVGAVPKIYALKHP